jgi:hypothetical protein
MLDKLARPSQIKSGFNFVWAFGVVVDNDSVFDWTVFKSLG